MRLPEPRAAQHVLVELQADELGVLVEADLERAQVEGVDQRPDDEDAEQDHHRRDHQVRRAVVAQVLGDGCGRAPRRRGAAGGSASPGSGRRRLTVAGVIRELTRVIPSAGRCPGTRRAPRAPGGRVYFLGAVPGEALLLDDVVDGGVGRLQRGRHDRHCPSSPTRSPCRRPARCPTGSAGSCLPYGTTLVRDDLHERVGAGVRSAGERRRRPRCARCTWSSRWS